jgi:hypothetical protein
MSHVNVVRTADTAGITLKARPDGLGTEDLLLLTKHAVTNYTMGKDIHLGKNGTAVRAPVALVARRDILARFFFDLFEKRHIIHG